jgi:hypothetical protein
VFTSKVRTELISEANRADLERKKRNPFAVKLKTKEFRSAPASSPPPPSPQIPGSQLSM